MLSSSRINFGYRLFEKFDIFGTPISIRFNNDQMHKTFYGTFFTALVLILLSLYSYSIIIQCLNYSRPNVIYQENIVAQPSRVDLTPQKFSMAMGIQDTTLTHFIDEQVYYLDVILKETTKVLNPKTNNYDQVNVDIPIKMVPCTPDHFQVEQTQNYFLKLKYINLYCFPLDSKINLEGQFGSNIYRRLYIQVKTCQNNCKPLDVLQKKLSNVAFQMYYVNYAVKPTDKDHPFQPIGQNTFWQSGFSLFKNINVYFRKTQVTSDYGLFVEDFYEDNRLLYSFDRETLITKTDNKMYEIYINLEKNKESEYVRTYMKLYSGFSQIGGIFNILFCVGCIICLPLSRSSLETKLMNQLFNFQERREKKKLTEEACQQYQGNSKFPNQSYKQRITQIGLSGMEPSNFMKSSYFKERDEEIEKNNSSKVNIIQQQMQQQKDNRKRKSQQENKQEPYIAKKQEEFSIDSSKNEIISPKLLDFLQSAKEKQNSINQQPQEKSGQIDTSTKIHQKFASKIGDKFKNVKISISHLLKSKMSTRLSNTKPVTKMINYGVEKLYNQLDIFYIMSKLIEIEKLKHLLLNEHQIKLFEFIPKPTIYLSDFEDEELEKKIRQLNQKFKRDILPDSSYAFNQPKFSLLSEDNRDEVQKAKDAEEAFHQIFKVQNSTSKIDQKLIQLLDPELIDMLEASSRNKFAQQQQQSIIKQESNYLEQIQLTQTGIDRRQITTPNQCIQDNELRLLSVEKDFDTMENRDSKMSPNIRSYQLTAKNNSLRFSQF